MTNNKDEKQSTNQLLIELFMTQVGTITNAIDKEGSKIFVSENLLSSEEIKDYSLEFLELLVVILQEERRD